MVSWYDNKRQSLGADAIGWKYSISQENKIKI